MGPYMAMPDAGWVWWMVVMAVIWVVPLVLVAWLAVTALRRDGADSPQRILRERFARGEIDQSEYEARRRALR